MSRLFEEVLNKKEEVERRTLNRDIQAWAALNAMNMITFDWDLYEAKGKWKRGVSLVDLAKKAFPGNDDGFVHEAVSYGTKALLELIQEKITRDVIQAHFKKYKKTEGPLNKFQDNWKSANDGVESTTGSEILAPNLS